MIDLERKSALVLSLEEGSVILSGFMLANLLMS